MILKPLIKYTNHFPKIYNRNLRMVRLANYVLWFCDNNIQICKMSNSLWFGSNRMTKYLISHSGAGIAVIIKCSSQLWRTQYLKATELHNGGKPQSKLFSHRWTQIFHRYFLFSRSGAASAEGIKILYYNKKNPVGMTF